MSRISRNKLIAVAVVTTLASLLAWRLSVRNIPFDRAAWAQSSGDWNGDTRYRMRRDVLRRLEKQPSGEAVVSMLGLPERGELETGYLSYRLGRHRKLLGVLGDTYWLSIKVQNGKAIQALVHPD